MKKILSLFLVLIMLSLCACSKNNAQNTDASSNPSHASTDNTEESTNSPTEGEHEFTENSTTTPGADEEETTKKPILSEDKQESIEKPITTPTKDPTTESTETPATKPTTCEHTYTTATCSMPKICTKCEYIAGHSLPHNYKNGVCTVCGWSEMVFNIKKGDWVANIVKSGTSDQGEILSQYILTQSQYVSAVCYSNASSCIVNLGKVIYNEKTYYVDYYPLGFCSVDWEENGDTITVTSRGGESSPKIVLTKTSETQLTVISSNDKAHIPVRTVFVKQ